MSEKPHVLNTPITAHGEEISQVTLRRPTVGECRAIKALPYKVDTDEAVKIDLDVAMKYIAICAGIPASSVNQLDLNDLNTLAWSMVGFFMRPAATGAMTA